VTLAKGRADRDDAGAALGEGHARGENDNGAERDGGHGDCDDESGGDGLTSMAIATISTWQQLFGQKVLDST
jgi:hypothetical protein